MKENEDILGLKIDFNSSVAFGTFPNNQNWRTLLLFLRHWIGLSKTTIAQSVFYLEILLFYQIEKYMDGKLFMYQCGFRSAQNCLLFMIEKWRKCLDNKGKTGVLLTDLSKV